MFIHSLGARFLRHGVFCVRQLCKRDLNTGTISDIANVVQQTGVPSGTSSQIVPRTFALRNVGIQVGLHARKILVDTVLNRVTNSLAARLREQAARRLLFGGSGTFFALVGVSLASGTGILTREDELEGVCLEIRDAVSKIKWTVGETEIDLACFENKSVSVNDLSFGKPIAKGANAVVYEANLVEHVNTTETRADLNKKEEILEYPLAVKMMFNYDIQSNALAILKAMYKETIPARVYYSNVGISDWEIEISKQKRHLPPHPNVVTMYSVFTDYVPKLQGAKNLYPAALPARIDPDGEGRNMSLFLLMKRYNVSLQNYLTSTPPTTRCSVLLFTQLLEGIAHLTSHGIAHRDLKSDNLLLDTSEARAPILVISDFGCCLAERNHCLQISYTSYEIDKGGNAALMPPEIATVVPGTFSTLNYCKSDLWAAGTIGYEIFGMCNPFYDGEGWKKLRSAGYKEEELPELPKDVPHVIKVLVRNLLNRNPKKRLDPDISANVCQLVLWAPSTWLNGDKVPTSSDVLQWLLCLTTKVLCEGRLSNTTPDKIRRDDFKTGRRTYTEYLLISSFLSRARFSDIKAALYWIQKNNQI